MATVKNLEYQIAMAATINILTTTSKIYGRYMVHSDRTIEITVATYLQNFPSKTSNDPANAMTNGNQNKICIYQPCSTGNIACVWVSFWSTIWTKFNCLYRFLDWYNL